MTETHVYDVIVAGAGYAGAACAWALANKGHAVLLIDQQTRENLGQKYVSIMIDVDTFSKTGIPRSEGDELLAYVDVFYAYSPSATIRKTVDFSSLLVNGWMFQQRLLDLGGKAGVTFLQGELAHPILEENKVVGVQLKDGTIYRSTLVVDATGMAQALRAHLPEAWHLHDTHRILEEQFGVAYRRIHTTTNTPTSEIHLHFNVEGGYVWRSAIDTGVGMMARMSEAEVKTLLDDSGKHYQWQLGPVTSEAIGKIPVRYPLTNLVASGYATVGDAAYMVNSVRGGGITAGLRGARILADTLSQAIADHALTLENMWAYNTAYHRQVGSKLAYQDAMRMTLMNESPENMEFLFAKDIVSGQDIKHSLGGQLLEFTPMQKISKGLRGASNPSLLLRFDSKLHWAGVLHQHFCEYPAHPEAFEAWEYKLQEIQAKLRI